LKVLKVLTYSSFHTLRHRFGTFSKITIVFRLHIGLGIMHISDEVGTQRNYSWDSDKLNQFLNELKAKNIKQVHLYPSKWRSVRWVERYFVDALLDFVKT